MSAVTPTHSDRAPPARAAATSPRASPLPGSIQDVAGLCHLASLEQKLHHPPPLWPAPGSGSRSTGLGPTPAFREDLSVGLPVPSPVSSVPLDTDFLELTHTHTQKDKHLFPQCFLIRLWHIYNHALLVRGPQDRSMADMGACGCYSIQVSDPLWDEGAQGPEHSWELTEAH